MILNLEHKSSTFEFGSKANSNVHKTIRPSSEKFVMLIYQNNIKKNSLGVYNLVGLIFFFSKKIL